jgi:hypothetical protein
MSTYSQHEVNRIFEHIPPRTLRQWALDGLYEWVGEEENGRGVHREYSYLNLLQIGLTEELAKANYNTKIIKGIMRGFSLDVHKDQNKALSYFKLFFVIIWPRNEKHEIYMGPMTSDNFKKDIDRKDEDGKYIWRKVMVIDLNNL